MKSANRRKQAIKLIVVAGIVFGLMLAGFVLLNLWRDRNTTKVSQDDTPTVEQTRQAVAMQETSSEIDQRLGVFRGSNDYDVSGGVSVVSVDGQRVLKFDDNFSSSAGPDLVVYLSKNSVGSGQSLGEFVSLSGLKSRSGAQVYTVPEDIDDFNSVVIWCRAFSAQFGAADLN